MKEPWWARLLALILNLLLGRQRAELEQEQKEIADAYREDFQDLADDGRPFDAAVGSLRDRAKDGDRGLPKAPAANRKGG